MKTKAMAAQTKAKKAFYESLCKFVGTLRDHVSSSNGQWTIKGFIDIYKDIYTISADTKIVSKILEIHLFPKFLEFAKEYRYKIVLAEQQNWYPDLSFISEDDKTIKFAVDLKTTYRDPEYPGHVNGFTLGSHGAYFTNRETAKNIQFPYDDYAGHYCLGIIYSRIGAEHVDETKIIHVDELEKTTSKQEKIGNRQITSVSNLLSITSVIKDFQFFVCEKWQLASDRQGSGNTANIGSITSIDDILKGNGVFAQLGEDFFDEYWMNYGRLKMKIKGKTVPLRKLTDFIKFKKGDPNLIVPVATKRKVNSKKA